MNFILLFTIATVLNVILSTIRSLCTVKASKTVAALSNAVCYGFYVWVIVLTVGDMPILLKVLITALANFICVYGVKWFEEKMRKDKLWKVEMAIPKTENLTHIKNILKCYNIPFSEIPIDNDRWVVFNCYCYKQKDTTIVTDVCKRYGGKISAYESQNLNLGV